MTRSAFISYSWDDDSHKEWVSQLAGRLRADGVNVTLDKWATAPGDQLPAFMEQAIRENQFIIIICTPRYKRRSEAREGGVGYEGDVMTAEVMNQRNDRKFIPVLRSGDWNMSAPSWISGKSYIDLTGNRYSDRNYEELVRTLLGNRDSAPPIGKPMATINTRPPQEAEATSGSLNPKFEDIRITGVIQDGITEPRNDGTYRSALYTIPFALSRLPPTEWASLFIENWDHPPRYTTMHRRGIASIRGATVILDGTTIDEVERYHRDTLQLALAESNRQYREWLDKQEQLRAMEEAQRKEHEKHVESVAKRLEFD